MNSHTLEALTEFFAPRRQEKNNNQNYTTTIGLVLSRNPSKNYTLRFIKFTGRRGDRNSEAWDAGNIGPRILEKRPFYKWLGGCRNGRSNLFGNGCRRFVYSFHKEVFGMSFRELSLTPAEFASTAKIDKSLIPALEASGLIQISRKKIGNVERKVIALEDLQNYFMTLRNFYSDEANANQGMSAPGQMGEGAESAGTPIPLESFFAAAGIEASVAAATGFVPRNPNHKVQMFYNVKGGTGKSTLTAQFVMRASMLGYRVLAIDLDGQGHLTVNLDVLDSHERPSIYDVLINDLPIQDAVMSVAPNLDLIPANLGLSNVEIPLNQKARREYRLAEAIAKVADQYDLIIADTNPAASILNGSMMVAANQVNIVCATNPLSFHGMSFVMSTIEEMQREFRRDFDVKIIPNMYDNREVISQEVLYELRAQFPEYCSSTVVNRSVDLNEATKRRNTVFGVNAKGTAANDIGNLTEELILR
jgi:chromosome partitioning protein